MSSCASSPNPLAQDPLTKNEGSRSREKAALASLSLGREKTRLCASGCTGVPLHVLTIIPPSAAWIIAWRFARRLIIDRARRSFKSPEIYDGYLADCCAYLYFAPRKNSVSAVRCKGCANWFADRFVPSRVRLSVSRATIFFAPSLNQQRWAGNFDFSGRAALFALWVVWSILQRCAIAGMVRDVVIRHRWCEKSIFQFYIYRSFLFSSRVNVLRWRAV